jgi:hypothetical protein
MSMSPFSPVLTTTIFIPAIAALAGFVPWALCGMRQTLRCPSPRTSWYFRITSRPAYSPCDPAFGCSDTAAKPVMSQRSASSVRNSSAYPSAWLAGANGWILPNSGHVTGIISAVALSFIVHEPSEIIECTSERSRDSSFRMYRSSSCSAW